MRLFLHGRYSAKMLLQRIEQAQAKEIDGIVEGASVSSSRYYTSVLLSNWNMDNMDQEVVDALGSFLKLTHPEQEETKQVEQSSEYKQQRRPCDEILTTSPSRSSLFSQFSKVASKIEDQVTREVTVQNCEGHESLEHLIALLMETNSSLTIRYDRQRDFPIHVARGLLSGAERITIARGLYNGSESWRDFFGCKLRSLTLKGMTITPTMANYLRATLPLLSNLEELVIRGNFTLQELDKLRLSVVGRVPTEMVRVVEGLHHGLKKLPSLRRLDLKQCHLPDEFLADLLESLSPESIEVLNLNGNAAHEESQHSLYQILSHPHCALNNLDLSWQRLPNARHNRSVLDFGILCRALEARNNSSLKVLNLSENRLLDQDVAHLAVVLSHHPSLGNVRLQDCFLGDRGILALAKELPRWPENLQSLHLDGEQRLRRPSHVRKSLFVSVLENVFLKELALPQKLQSESTDWALELNRAGRRALLDSSSGCNEIDCPDPAIECTITKAPSFDSQTGTNHICDALWPRVLERADTIARRESNREESATIKAASAVYLLLREKGYHAVLQHR